MLADYRKLVSYFPDLLSNLAGVSCSFVFFSPLSRSGKSEISNERLSSTLSVSKSVCVGNISIYDHRLDLMISYNPGGHHLLPHGYQDKYMFKWLVYYIMLHMLP